MGLEAEHDAGLVSSRKRGRKEGRKEGRRGEDFQNYSSFQNRIFSFVRRLFLDSLYFLLQYEESLATSPENTRYKSGTLSLSRFEIESTLPFLAPTLCRSLDRLEYKYGSHFSSSISSLDRTR